MNVTIPEPNWTIVITLLVWPYAYRYVPRIIMRLRGKKPVKYEVFRASEHFSGRWGGYLEGTMKPLDRWGGATVVVVHSHSSEKLCTEECTSRESVES